VDSTFKAIENDYFGNISKEYDIVWVPEISLGVGGSVDYVAVKMKKFGALASFEDFVCVEFQAAGTTGTPWEAVQEYKKNGKFSKDSYDYGINWANEFAKTMMQQVYKKGQIIEYWKEKIIFVTQDVALDYLRTSYNTSGLREKKMDDPIYFYTFRMEWNEKSGSWLLRLHEKLSTNTEGIRKILAGADSQDFPTKAQFIENIKRKLNQ